MLISFVISCYNASTTILNLLDSITLNNTTEYEIVVVDDGSSDGSYEVLMNFKKSNSRVPIQIIKQLNQGSAAARNTGLFAATGKYIFFCDSDDSVYSQEIIDSCKNRDDVDCVIGNYVKTKSVDGDVYFVSSRDSQIPISNQLEESSWREKLVARKGWWAIIYRKEFLQSQNLKFLPNFTEAGGFFVLDDLFFLFQLYARSPRILMTDKIFYRYTQDSSVHDRQYLDQLKLQTNASRVYHRHISRFTGPDSAIAANFMINRLIGTYKFIEKEISPGEKFAWCQSILQYSSIIPLREKLKLPLRVAKMVILRN